MTHVAQAGARQLGRELAAAVGAGRDGVSGLCFPEGAGCFPEASVASDRMWGSASHPAWHIQHSAHPQGRSGWQIGSSHGSHFPVPLSPVQGVWGYLSPCCCCCFLWHSREGNGQERVIGVTREGCRGNEVASGQPAALMHILACSCVAPGFPPSSLGPGGCDSSLFRAEVGALASGENWGLLPYLCSMLLTHFCAFECLMKC